MEAGGCCEIQKKTKLEALLTRVGLMQMLTGRRECDFGASSACQGGGRSQHLSPLLNLIIDLKQSRGHRIEDTASKRPKIEQNPNKTTGQISYTFLMKSK